MIEIKNLQKMWTNGNVVLEDINLCIADGEIYGLAGRSGAGKSTLLRCINGLESFSSGTLTVNNVAVNRLNKEELRQFRKNIGMIFQQPSILERKTVYENIAFPMKCWGVPEAERRAKAEELIHLVELDEKRDVKAKTLSGGQKQRVAIARALASNPKVLLCDEATSALDPATTHSILKLLKEINRTLGITILLITHEMDVVKRICDLVAIIDHGKLVEQGSVGDIFSNPKTELAQQFIRSTFSVNLPDEYLDNLLQTPKHAKSYPIIKFEFTGRSVDAPLLSQASKKFGVELSILTSQIEYAGGVKFGFTVAEVEGDEDAITQTKIYLMENNVRVEVLGYVE